MVIDTSAIIAILTQEPDWKRLSKAIDDASSLRISAASVLETSIVLESRFGPRSGAWLHARGNLLDNTPISVTRETKSQSVETTFDEDVADLPSLERTLYEQTEELCRRLKKKDLEGRSIGIKVRLDDWTNITRSQSVESPTNDPDVVWPIALELLRAYDPPRPVRLLGVRLASFGDETETAPAPEEDEPQLRLALPG